MEFCTGVGCFLGDKVLLYHFDFIKSYILKANLKSGRKFMPRVINYLKKKDCQVSSKLKLVKLIHYLR